MHIHGDIFLCDHRDARGDYQLYAVLDELTLTYDIVQRRPRGVAHPLRRHVLSLDDARHWASAFTGGATPHRAGRPQRGR
jgi:hypothetical protein